MRFSLCSAEMKCMLGRGLDLLRIGSVRLELLGFAYELRIKRREMSCGCFLFVQGRRRQPARRELAHPVPA